MFRHVVSCQGGSQQESKKGGGPIKQALMDTIQGLQKALERSRKEFEAAVSSAKYMQVGLHADACSRKNECTQ